MLDNVLDFSIHLLPGAELILSEQQSELPQKNELCGAFWITLALRAFAKIDVQQDHVGIAAHSILSEVQTHEFLPPGENGRDDYVLKLPRIGDSELAGTSPLGLALSVDELASGKLVATPATGSWTGQQIESLISELALLGEPCLVIANSATRYLWGGRPSPMQLFGYLNGISSDQPDADWNVGHYISILGWLEGPSSKLAICGDTYRSLGWQGVHLQPFSRIADSLRRDDSDFCGGIFVVSDLSTKNQVTLLCQKLGLSCELWDNGTPFLNSL